MKQRILVAALDWGMGHATRTVPLIRQFQSEGHEVILAAAGSAKKFYENYFPELKIISKPAYDIEYSKYFSFSLSIIMQIPKISIVIARERRWLKKIIATERISMVVSDNCYGLYNRSVKCIFITHQLMIKLPGVMRLFESFAYRRIRSYIKKFNECYIPDFEGRENLSGDLSHKYSLPKNAKYIGPLSRFKKSEPKKLDEDFDIVVLISGPEPDRSILEEKFSQVLRNLEYSVCIVRGRPGWKRMRPNNHGITWFNHLPDSHLHYILSKSKKIICRPGYSTLMDLNALGLKALLIPTPGQTEHEYLAEWNSKKDGFDKIDQKDLTIEKLKEKIGILKTNH